MTGTRNPSRKYFKRNQPYFYKSVDNWEEWDTDESYDRTFFIGIDDSDPEDIDVALYMIWGGKAIAVVGSKVLDTVSDVVDTAKLLEEEIQSILEEVQEITAALAQARIDIEEAITEMNALIDRCEGILDGAEAARDLAQAWATKMDGMVEEDGQPVDYSAKYYANEAKNSETAASTSATTASASATTATEQATSASTSAEQAATSASTAASYAATAHIDASGAANSAASADTSATNAANSATASANSATASANSATASAASAQAAQDTLDDVHGLLAIPIGTIFQSVYVDESLDMARALTGQLISSTKFTGFRSWLNKVQTAIPNLFTTETNWQAEKALSKFGQVGKFVIDDTASTIRLPAVVNPQGLLGLSGIGNLVNESLPNITGEIGLYTGSRVSGSFATMTRGSSFNLSGAPAANTEGIDFSASRSSSTYQDNAPVQQEAIQYPYYIQVATGIEETLPAIREYEINTPFFFGQSMYSENAPYNASWLASNGQYNARAVYPDYYDWLVEQMNKGVDKFKGTTAYQFKGNTPETEEYTPSFATRNPIVGSVFYGGYPIRTLGYVTQVNADGSVVAQDVENNRIVTFVFKQELPNIPWFTDYDFAINQNDQTFRLPLKSKKDFVVDSGVSIVNNIVIRWRKYASGLLEQWGDAATTAPSTALTVSLAKNYATINDYNVTMLPFVNSGVVNNLPTPAIQERRTNAFVCSVGSYDSRLGAIGFTWKTEGQGAEASQGLYYYVGETVQDASLINAGAVLGQLSNKVDIDASNFTPTGKSTISGLGFLDTTKFEDNIVNKTVTNVKQTYIAPANGHIYFVNESSTPIVIYGTNCGSLRIGVAAGAVRQGSVSIQKGGIAYILTQVGTATLTQATFYYAKGEV
jgi:hypothetical protein